MRPRLALLLAITIAALALAPATASAAFGFQPGAAGFDVSIEYDRILGADAGSHPFEMGIGIGLNRDGGGLSDGDLRDLSVDFPPGLLLNPIATAPCVAGLCDASSAVNAVCLAADFNTPRGASPTYLSGESCPNATQVGTIAVTSSSGGPAETRHFGLFNIPPPHGTPMAIGASPYGIPLVFTPHVREADAGLTFGLHNLSQERDLQAFELTLWGTPWDVDHNGERGDCLNEEDPNTPHGNCNVFGPVGASTDQIKSLITLPPGPCGVPLEFSVAARSWQEPGTTVTTAGQANGGDVLGECKFSLTIPRMQLTTRAAGIGSGLVFTLDATAGGGIFNPGGVSLASLKRVVVSMPEGLTVNPAVASGLQGCTPAQFAQETLHPASGAGCPDASKVGALRVEEMMGIPKPVEGSLYIATPYDNPMRTLIALYIVTRSEERGLLVRSVGKLEPDPRTGRLVVTFDDLPRLLYTRFTADLRGGLRSVFVSPLACSNYMTETPDVQSWADTPPHPLTRSSSTFIVDNACPPPGAPAFSPGLRAGSINPNASSYSPFYLQMTRSDAEQEITSYSATFPPGLLGKIAGVPYCPEGAAQAARDKSAAQELAGPSCPAASEIGSTVTGYGVGGILAWAPGKLYLAGPYKGAPLSVLAIDAAKIGPFDLGTVVVRSGIRIDRETAQASIDATGADPIPHILAGIPIHVRDIRVFVDRPDFIVNPTNCAPLEVASALTGAGANLFDGGADDSRATTTTPYNLLNCSALGFRPRLAFKLGGKTKHGAYPALRATYTPRPGEANLARARASLPPSLFLAQEHIGRICTRRESLADACPAESIYGYAQAYTPLLDEPMQGPIYLRSSDNLLPDLVFALRGPGGLEVALPGTIDSGGGDRIRVTFKTIPDAPLTRFVVRMKGGGRGLLINAASLCATPQRAGVAFTGHNGIEATSRPALRARCAKAKKKRRRNK